jgi:hypothetical protein
MWTDLDFADLVMYVRRAYVWDRFKMPKSKVSKAPVQMHPVLAGFLMAWMERTPYAKDDDYVFPNFRLNGKKPGKKEFARFEKRKDAGQNQTRDGRAATLTSKS